MGSVSRQYANEQMTDHMTDLSDLPAPPMHLFIGWYMHGRSSYYRTRYNRSYTSWQLPA